MSRGDHGSSSITRPSTTLSMMLAESGKRTSADREVGHKQSLLFSRERGARPTPNGLELSRLASPRLVSHNR